MSDTKSKIVIGAIKLFSKSPSASIEEIGKSINLSRRTLHRYFSSKSELITEITAYASNHCLLKTKESMQSSTYPIDNLKAMFLSDIESGYQFRFLYNYRDNIQELEEESSDFREMMQIFRALLKRLQNNNLIIPALTLEWVESFYFSTINAAIDLILEDENNEKQIVQMAWLSYFNGIIIERENLE